MHPALASQFQTLKSLREAAGLSQEDVEQQLVLGPGWVSLLESGNTEPSVGVLAALLSTYGSDLSSFFADIDFGEASAVVDRELVAVEEGQGLALYFPMGAHQAKVTLAGATLDEFNDVLRVLRRGLEAGTKRPAIVASFLRAVELWPSLNPSDLWYFLISHAYQDGYNQPPNESGMDWAQSWKRASGWALEEVYVQHYNPFLLTQGLKLVMPTDPAAKIAMLQAMGMQELSHAQKADVIAVGIKADGSEEPFGVVHVKASFAERRTDDVPLSQQLIARGFASPLLTMDCKASPGAAPINRGELGPVQGGSAEVSPKRLDIEEHRKFDACFSYNSRSLPTPADQAASARIRLCDFSDADDNFSKYLLRRWRERQGLD